MLQGLVGAISPDQKLCQSLVLQGLVGALIPDKKLGLSFRLWKIGLERIAPDQK